jgi:flavin reductase (DIM6/NTAB) family NADH-FMN oxidoreductase RutF
MNPRTEHPSVQAGFREAMAMVCTPVAVVTAQRSGVPFGTTVSAFTSLSMDPPMLLVSLDRGSGLLAVIRDVGQFGVNVLSNQQADLATNFAVKGGTEKFDGITWHLAADVPQLPGSVAFVSCRAAEMVEGGDHVVMLGEVVAVHHCEHPPLTYHRRGFGTHSEPAGQSS